MLAGHQVYNFRDPQWAFSWGQVNMPSMPTAAQQREILLTHPRAAQGFVNDFRGMLWADVCVLLLPAGRSAHLEAGYCAGAGRHVIAYLRDGEEPDLMNLLMHKLVTTDQELLEALVL
jgi:nucleoside 2-deoxyribosyltransferase